MVAGEAFPPFLASSAFCLPTPWVVKGADTWAATVETLLRWVEGSVGAMVCMMTLSCAFAVSEFLVKL